MVTELGCIACHTAGIDRAASTVIGGRSLCTEHAHPSAVPHRPQLTLIQGGRT